VFLCRYSIVKDQNLISTKRRNFNPQQAGFLVLNKGHLVADDVSAQISMSVLIISNLKLDLKSGNS